MSREIELRTLTETMSYSICDSTLVSKHSQINLVQRYDISLFIMNYSHVMRQHITNDKTSEYKQCELKCMLIENYD